MSINKQIIKPNERQREIEGVSKKNTEAQGNSNPTIS